MGTPVSRWCRFTHVIGQRFCQPLPDQRKWTRRRRVGGDVGGTLSVISLPAVLLMPSVAWSVQGERIR
jgi:5-formyltetrahydrofolate cyclo-ligase